MYTHFEDNGISVGLVFRLRQLRERIVRVRLLLDCLLSPKPALAAARLMSSLVQVGQELGSAYMAPIVRAIKDALVEEQGFQAHVLSKTVHAVL